MQSPCKQWINPADCTSSYYDPIAASFVSAAEGPEGFIRPLLELRPGPRLHEPLNEALTMLLRAVNGLCFVVRSAA